jgi:GGDEF domain-containing protein
VRFGGDEFVALLPGCTQYMADRLLERVRQSAPIRFSVGLAWWCSGDDAIALLARADTQLYDAKRVNRGETAPLAS